MRLRCPECGARLTLAAAERAEAAAAMAAEAAFWGPDFPVVAEYVACFRTRPGGEVQAAKRLRLCREVREMATTGRLRYHGQDWAVRRQDLVAGLRLVANRELVGLRNHNYLKAVVVGRLRQGGGRGEGGGGQGPRPAGGGQAAPPAAAGPGKRKVIEIPDE